MRSGLIRSLGFACSVVVLAACAADDDGNEQSGESEIVHQQGNMTDAMRKIADAKHSLEIATNNKGGHGSSSDRSHRGRDDRGPARNRLRQRPRCFCGERVAGSTHSTTLAGDSFGQPNMVAAS